MSHFAVLVLKEVGEDLFDILEPYMENCCDEPGRKYMEFYEDDDCDVDPYTGKRGYWQNPNARWDWFEVGGRFSNLLRCKGAKAGCKGVDAAPLCDVDTTSLAGGSPFAFRAVVTADGEWHEVGRMGWFGFSSESAEEADAWERGFVDTFIEPAADDLMAVVVDCHI